MSVTKCIRQGSASPVCRSSKSSYGKLGKLALLAKLSRSGAAPLQLRMLAFISCEAVGAGEQIHFFADAR